MKNIAIALLTFINFNLSIGQENSLLWTIAKEGQTDVSYLYGTIHIKDQRAYHISDCLLPAIQDADVLALELDLDDVDLQAFQSLLFLPEGQTLNDLYSADDIKLIDSVFQEMVGLSIDPALMKMQPFALSMMIIESFFSNDYTQALDMYLNNYAKQNNTDVIGLEELEDQLTIIQDFKPEFLISDLKDIPNARAVLENLMIEYDKGDIDALLSIMQQDIRDSLEEKYLDKLLYQRNVNMANRIQEIIKDRQAVVAVGAGHLGGSKGIIQLLRDKGFTVDALICDKQFIEKENSITAHTIDNKNWIKIDQDHFSISFPSKPDFDEVHIPSDDMDLFMDMYVLQNADVEGGNIMYFLGITSFPDSLIHSDMPRDSVENFLHNSIFGGIEQLNGVVEQEIEINQNGYQGKSVVASMYGGLAFIHMRAVLYKSQLFLLQIMTMDRNENSEIEKFYNSLKLKSK